MLGLRLAFALLVPALIATWTLVSAFVGQQSPATPAGNRGAAGEAGRLYQAEETVTTPTIEVYDPDTAKASTPTPVPLDERAALFDQVWGTIEENYLDPEFNGTDWAGLRDEYRRRALDAPTSYDFYAALAEMVGTLNDENSTFTPPENLPVPTTTPGTEGGYANIGITRVFDDNSLLVLYVYPGGPAEESGIKRRDRITAINGKPVTSGSDAEALSGLVGSAVSIVVRSSDGQEREMTLKREIVVGQAPLFSRQLNEDPTVDYLAIPNMAAAGLDYTSIYLLDKMHKLMLLQDVPLKGLVIDLRHSTGNSQLNLAITMGQLTQGNLGTFESRNPENTAPLDVIPCCMHDKLIDTPIVLLVDEGTQGDAEIMAAALQTSGRAKLVGTRTAGLTQSTAQYTYGDGSTLVFPQWRYILPDGSNLEGRGLDPDVEVSEDWTQFTEENDPYIQAAVELLHSMQGP